MLRIPSVSRVLAVLVPLALSAITAILLAIPGIRDFVPSAQVVRPCVVQRIIDGDTFVCADAERVRLILVNTPEMDQQPLGSLARTFLVGVMPPGTEIDLEIGVDARDRYGRLLAYATLPDGRMVNRVLARRGYAQTMVVPPNVKYVEVIRAAVDSAQAESAGLWGVEARGR